MAAGEDAAAWRDALATPGWADAARVLKEDRGSWVRRANLLGRDVVVKCRELNTIGRRFKHAIGMGHGAKHWRGAAKLMRAEIPTGRPLVLMRSEVDGCATDLLVIEFVPGETLLSVLDAIAHGCGPGVREQHAIAKAVAGSVVALRKARLHNRDHKPSNIIVTHAEDGRVGVSVIDTVGLESDFPVGDGFEVEEMLTALMVEPLGCGCSPRRSLWMRALSTMPLSRPNVDRARKHRDLREAAKSVAMLIKAHGDPRPRVNPLAENRQSR